jgi:hypothetical protein
MEIEGGESLWSMKVKLEDVLVCGTQFTNVIDIVRIEYKRLWLDLFGHVLSRLQGLDSLIKSTHVGAPQFL